MFFVLKNLLCSCLLLMFFFCFALIFSSQNYLLALQYFVLFSNCFLLCLLSNNFDCSQIVFGWVCSPIFFSVLHTWYLSRTPRIYSCKFFLAGVNFYRFNAKNWHFRQILREKVAFFTYLTRKIGVFRCKFYYPKILPV